MTPSYAQTEEQKQLSQNIEKTTKTADNLFPNETWVDAVTVKFDHVKLPDGVDSIMVAMSRLPVNQQEELDFLKEIKSAIILKNEGASIRLIPRMKRPDGKGNLPGPDAIVNGLLFEFKTITGKIKKVGKRFTESRKQGENIYIRVANPLHTKAGVISSLVRIINNKDYVGGYKGNVIFTVGDGGQEKTYFFKISDLKAKKSGEALRLPRWLPML
jgi:hypothetical protein